MQYQYITLIPEGKYFILFIFAFYIDYSHPHANVCVYMVNHKNETHHYHLRLLKKVL